MTVSHSHGNHSIALPADQAQIQSRSRLSSRDPQPYSAILDVASPHVMWSFGAVFRSIALFIWALTASCFTMAQDSSAHTSTDVSELEEVVVSSRTPDLIDQIGVSVSVLDEDMMRSLAYPDLASLLDTQPGVTVTMDGGYGKAAAVRIRGEEGYRTRIVLDGINIADPSSPQVSPRIEHLVSSGLTRVEILRGPQGLLWGADAGGVILMSTTDPIIPP